MGCWVWPERMSWFAWLPMKKAQTTPSTPPPLLSFPNRNHVSILKKAAFNGRLCLQQVCLNVCGTFNDIFYSPFPPFHATVHWQDLIVKCIILQSLLQLKPVNNLVTWSSRQGQAEIYNKEGVFAANFPVPYLTAEWEKACNSLANYWLVWEAGKMEVSAYLYGQNLFAQ